MIQFSFRARLDLSPCLPEIDLVNQKISSGIVNELVEIECVVKDYVTLWDHGYWHSLHQLLGSSLYTLPGTWKIKKKKDWGSPQPNSYAVNLRKGAVAAVRGTQNSAYTPFLTSAMET